MTYQKGNKYVLLLRRTHLNGVEKLGLLSYPFSRISEDYAGEDSLWIRTIRRYVALQGRLQPMEQLDDLAATLKGLDVAKPEERALANDIADHLMSRSQFKPTQYLIDTYNALRLGTPLKFPLRPSSADREMSAAQAFTDLMFGTAPHTANKDEQIYSVLAALVEGDHPSAAPIFEAIANDPTAHGGQLGLAVEFFAKHGRLRHAYDIFERNLFRMALSDREGGAFVYSGQHAMNGDDYEAPRWKQDAYLAKAWPHLKLAIVKWDRLMGGDDNLHSGEMSVLKPNDWRSDPELSLLFASAGNDDVVTWAYSELFDVKRRREWEEKVADAEASEDYVELPEDPARLPLLITTRALSAYKKNPLLDVFCQSDSRRALAIQILPAIGDEFWLGIPLRKMAAYPGLTVDDRHALIRALSAITAAKARKAGVGRYLDGGEKEQALMEALARGEKIDLKGASPLQCPGR
jgi:hypothetical protein